MTTGHQSGDGSARVVAQFLEGGAASTAVEPDAAVACLRRASDILPLSDVCLGWNLPQALIDAVGRETHRLGQRLWLWHPLLSGDGQFTPGDGAALGPGGRVIPWPRGMAEFAFDCPVHRSGLEAALSRLQTAIDSGPWEGVLLDKIRWPSPTRDPTVDLACFCPACEGAASSVGIDLKAVAARLDQGAADGSARHALLLELLGVVSAEPLSSFMAWRQDRITEAVTETADLVGARTGPSGAPLRVALDVFAPSLARLVGQDIVALSRLGEMTKAMLYLGTYGPAGLPYELCALARWLDAGHAGDPVDLLARALDIPLSSRSRLCQGSLDPSVFALELERLGQRSGPGAAAGIDAVEISDIAVLDDPGLEATVRLARQAGSAIVLAWDLWSMSPHRLEAIARALEDRTDSGTVS